MVVTLLLLVFAWVGINFFWDAQGYARDARRREDVKSMALALESHHSDEPGKDCPKPERDSYCALRGGWFVSGTVPLDPTRGDYYNLPKSGDKVFLICARLERGGGNSGDLKGASASGAQAQYYCLRNQQ